MKNVLVSGIQPSGNLHLGNYIGAMSNWKDYENRYDCFFPVVDLHAITVNPDSVELRKAIMHTVAIYLAIGLDPEKSNIFIQSSVKEHLELAWILNCHTPIGKLNRMTQFKNTDRNKTNLGLLSYPVLMAADILLYKASHVPVGGDQKQHLELTKELAGIINRKFNKEVFKIPSHSIFGEGIRIKSLSDETNKMSKSDPSDFSRINLLDNPDIIREKIKKSKTGILWTDSAANNLIQIYTFLTGFSASHFILHYGNKGFATFKSELSDIIIDCLTPIQQQYEVLIKNQDYLHEALKKGTKKAQEKATTTMKEIKELIGLI